MKLLFALLVIGLVVQTYSKYSFPKNFAWGVASAAYQIEGGWNADGRGPSIWDTFSHTPGRVYKNQTGDVADNFYYLYPVDIAMMQGMGIRHFRMSLSWSRILPNGTVDNVNEAGVKFYNDLFDTLLNAGIEPWVTLYHWDLPQALDDHTDNGGWLNPNISEIFNQYADFCFKTFGGKVKKWLTFNEISTFAWVGYAAGVHAPGRCSPEVGSWCKEVGGGGNTATEPYIVVHHVLIGHGLAVQTYRNKYQKAQNGTIGLTINCGYSYPFDPSNPDDIKAVEINELFSCGYYGDPIAFGKYPDIMHEMITGNRLPNFTEAQSQLLKGSYDFIGINHYTSKYVKWTGVVGNTSQNDARLYETPTDVNGHLIGPYADSSWLNVYPKGFRDTINWFDKRYNRPLMYVFENGVSCPGESNLPLEQALNDTFRVNYLKDYIANMALAILEDGVNLQGYFSWSIIDNFEWADGYNVRFGMTYVDYNNGGLRHPKSSAKWYSLLIKTAQGKEDGEEIKQIIDQTHLHLDSKQKVIIM